MLRIFWDALMTPYIQFPQKHFKVIKKLLFRQVEGSLSDFHAKNVCILECLHASVTQVPRVAVKKNT